MRIASAAGIQVVATGGIGGVHRGYAESLDISADLWEIARTPVVVVCSGVKAIADIPASLEWLETHGVPVYGYETDVFPAFYSRSSGLPAPRIDSVCDLVEVLKVAAATLGLRCGVVLGVPIPEADEIDVSSSIEQAVREASEKGIAGKALTPYLLNRVGELTGGRSVDANTALLRHNAQVAGEIAVALAEDTGRRMGFTV
jgi:pseudouridine-5'-phosphate glycosidase